MRTQLSTKAMTRLVMLRLNSLSMPDIAATLAREGYKTASGGAWYPSTVKQYLEMASKALIAPSHLGAPRGPRRARVAA